MIFGRTIAYYKVPDTVSEFILGFARDSIQKLLHLMMIPIPVCFLCTLAPWTVLAIPRLLVPPWL